MLAKRQRLTPGESRARAIDAARALLLEGGPHAVTLKAVAARIGQTHANLLHHFGSAAGLQTAVMENVAGQLVSRAGAAVYQRRQGDIGIRELVDIIFDTYGKDGAGRLASWMILTGDRQALDPVFRAMTDFINRIAVDAPNDEVRRISLAVTLMALGDALLGAPIADAIGVPQDEARQLAAGFISSLSGIPLSPAVEAAG